MFGLAWAEQTVNKQTSRGSALNPVTLGDIYKLEDKYFTLRYYRSGFVANRHFIIIKNT